MHATIDQTRESQTRVLHHVSPKGLRYFRIFLALMALESVGTSGSAVEEGRIYSLSVLASIPLDSMADCTRSMNVSVALFFLLATISCDENKQSDRRVPLRVSSQIFYLHRFGPVDYREADNLDDLYWLCSRGREVSAVLVQLERLF